ncbi:MAG: rhomboid family intramembrane serine protease [Hyphomicrobium sp.]|jgi:membrane associated rhomboid family serine protease|nr:rhomboid family intramembrane serine protease [Hyphomicrobium sp.]
MFPVGDDDTAIRSTSYVTYTLVVINVLVFLLELSRGDTFIREWAFVPARFTQHPAGDAVTVLSAMFMHGGWMHLFGNMLYLWIFGNNVEDRFGPMRFLAFYLTCGLAATFAQYYFVPHSNVPNVGASGAIAGVLGAYLVLFPRARVNVAIGYSVVPMPALVVLGFWIVLQLFSGVGSVAATDETMRDAGGIAYMAHIGGFLAGIVLALVMRGSGRTGRIS